jgi:hypothetical protein
MKYRPQKHKHTSPRDIQQEEFIEIKALGVFSWSPGKLSENLPCTQIHLRLEIDDALPPLVMRLRSRKVADELIAALIAERDFVWPDKK